MSGEWISQNNTANHSKANRKTAFPSHGLKRVSRKHSKVAVRPTAQKSVGVGSLSLTSATTRGKAPPARQLSVTYGERAVAFRQSCKFLLQLVNEPVDVLKVGWTGAQLATPDDSPFTQESAYEESTHF